MTAHDDYMAAKLDAIAEKYGKGSEVYRLHVELNRCDQLLTEARKERNAARAEVERLQGLVALGMTEGERAAVAMNDRLLGRLGQLEARVRELRRGCSCDDEDDYRCANCETIVQLKDLVR